MEKVHKNAFKNRRRQTGKIKRKSECTTVLQINPRPITITHFSKVLLSCENVCVVVIICSNSKLSLFLFHAWIYVLAATNGSWQNYVGAFYIEFSV